MRKNMKRGGIENPITFFEKGEIEGGVKIGIYDETHPLKSVAIWGHVGAEALLAQFYPKHISLFYDKMDVLSAREETEKYLQTLKENGVQVTLVRDELADLLPIRNLKREDIIDKIIKRGGQIQKDHGDSTPFKDVAVELVEQDIKKYGEQKALALNEVLVLQSRLPLGNVLFSRDQTNVILGTRIKASMAKEIRKPEVSLYEMVYRKVLGENHIVSIPFGETFEGGDAYVHDGIVYVGVGTRTTIDAAKHIYKSLIPQLKENGFEFVVVVDPKAMDKSHDKAQETMHLDTFSMPVTLGKMLVCEEEASARDVYYLTQNSMGDVVIDQTRRNETFLEHIKTRKKEIIPIPECEQKTFGANLLVLGNSKVLVPLEINKSTIQGLEEAGLEVISVDLNHCTSGYGATHCMTNQFERGN